MIYEIRNSHNDIIYKNEDKQLAIIYCDWLSEQNNRLTYIVVEVKEVYRKE